MTREKRCHGAPAIENFPEIFLEPDPPWRDLMA